MERIATASLTLHATDVGGLERARGALGERPGAFARELADRLGASELVLLSTCNRLEVTFAREEGHWPCEQDLVHVADALALGPELAARVRFHRGRDAARHLFRVVCSLDSLVVGEDQILAQVREAYARSEHDGLTGILLGPLYTHAFQVGKQVRACTPLSRNPVSVVTLAAQHVARAFPDGAPRVAVLGAGTMGRLLARALREVGVAAPLFVNRTEARAAELAATHGGSACSLARFAAGGEPVDALIAATAAPCAVLPAAALVALAARTPSGAPLVAVDVGLPRNLPASDDPRLRVVDLDALRGLADENRGLRAAAAAEAERLVEEKLEVWARRLHERALATALADVRAESDEVLRRELAQLFTGKLAELDERERAAVERWARGAFGKLAHLPVAALKRFAAALESNAAAGVARAPEESP